MDGAASVASTRPQPVVIRPPKRWVGFGLRELWRFRELLVFLAWRDLKVRYKQTILGVAWAILQPLLYTLVATLLFKRLLGVYSVGPYELLALAGFVFWLPFANAVTLASNSLVGNASLMTKVYFPRLLAPLGTIAASGVDLALSTGLLVVFMAAYGEFPDPQRVWVAIPAVLRRRCHRDRRRLVARRAERQVPRHPVRRAVRAAALAVRQLGLHHVHRAQPERAVARRSTG